MTECHVDVYKNSLFGQCGIRKPSAIMSRSERTIPPTSISLKLGEASCGIQGTRRIHEPPVDGRGDARSMPSNCTHDALNCEPPKPEDHLRPSSPTVINHSLPARLNFPRHDTVGVTHCDGQGQVWCDGLNWTNSRTSIDALRPLSPGASAVAMKTLLSNVARLDDFEREKIGSGFFSDVYKVRHKITGQVLVLKMNNNESNIASIIQEISLLKKLQHPNIIRLLGVCIHESSIHALIEYMNGGNLSTILLDGKLNLPWQDRLGIAKDIASGMSFLHMHSVIHRDLTSMNCLVKKNNNGSMHAVVADLGLAARIPRDHSEQLPTVGTPFWVSPENLNAKFYNEKTDLFSFGIILCEIIARVTANPDELPRLHNFGLDTEAFRTLCGNCPEQLLLLAISCCDMEPSKRPAFTEVVLSIRHIEADIKRQSKRPPPLFGRLRSLSTVVQPYMDDPTSKPSQVRIHPRNSIVRSNSDSSFRPLRLRSASKKWVNPFDTPHLKNGRTKLTAVTAERTSMFTALFELPSEIVDLLQDMCQEEDEEEEEERSNEQEDKFLKKRSMSLPNFPVSHHHHQLSHLDENTNFVTFSIGPEDDFDAAGRRKTISPGFVTPTLLEKRRAMRSRSKTTSEVFPSS